MIRTTPFHERLSELNSQSLYTHWQGHLSALRYTDAPKHEYFAVRNSVGVFDTSPLFKYRIYGPDAERLLAGVLVRDIRACRPGQAHYTVWCDDRGFVMEDGVVFRHSESDFLLTTARPNLGWFADHGRPASRRHRGRLRRLRHPRRPGPAVTGRAGLAGARGRVACVLRARPDQDRVGPGHAVAHRLHRRPRLRDHRRGRARRRRPRRGAGCRPASRHAPLRRGGAEHAPHRSRARARRRGVDEQPARVHRRRAGHAEGARLRLDAARRARRRPGVRRPRRDPS